MDCPKCKSKMQELVFLYICVNCDLALTEKEILKENCRWKNEGQIL